jgi:site-specific recombinase XerD
MSLERCILEWLDEKHKHSQSTKTERAYRETLLSFRGSLRTAGLDLDCEASIIAPLARRFCDASQRGVEVTPATFNQRRSILSSFYKFAISHEVLARNPLTRVTARKNRKQHAALPLSKEEVSTGLRQINTTTLQGLRNRALLAVALMTGRRVSELAGLRLGHLQLAGRYVHVSWIRTKGNERAENMLDARTSAALLTYLEAAYGTHNMSTLIKERIEAPVWMAFSRNPAYQGHAIGVRAIQRLCEKHLGTSKFHALRHTHAVTKHKLGASLAEVGKSLGHKNLKTTSDYLEELLGYDDPYAAALAEDFGI